MLYLKLSDDRHVIVFEPTNLDRMRAGQPVVSPDREVFVACVPDLPWLAEQTQLLSRSGELTPERFSDLLGQAFLRPEQPPLPYHEQVTLLGPELKPPSGG